MLRAPYTLGVRAVPHEAARHFDLRLRVGETGQ